LINQSDYKYKDIFTDKLNDMKISDEVANAAEAAV